MLPAAALVYGPYFPASGFFLTKFVCLARSTLSVFVRHKPECWPNLCAQTTAREGYMYLAGCCWSSAKPSGFKTFKNLQFFLLQYAGKVISPI